MAYLWRLHYHEYYRITIVSLLLCAVHAVLAWLGFKYTEGTGKGTSSIPYHVINIPTASVFLIETVASLIIFLHGRMAYYKGSPKSSAVESLDAFVFQIGGIIVGLCWGIPGCVLIAKSGLCIKNEQCYYTINTRANLAVAIISLFLHVLFLFWHWTFMACRSKGHTDNTITPLPPQLQSTASNITPQSKTESNGTRPSIPTNPSDIVRFMKDLSMTQKNHSTTDIDTEQNRKLRRQTSKFKLHAMNAVPKRPDPSVVNEKYTFNFQRRMTDEYMGQHVGKAAEKPKSPNSPQETQVTPLAPPPTYEQAISMPSGEVIIANPYYLPPLITRHSRLRVPDDIYSGTNYPDEELEVAHAQLTNRYV